MAERPILMSAPMVRAILAGTKTQTRRVVKPQPETIGDAYSRGHADDGSWLGEGCGAGRIRCPYGQPGDRLWVRETFRKIDGQTEPWIETDYRATYTQGARLGDSLGVKMPWTPAIHMPRAASRITLEVTGVRADPLQEISEPDAVAEGIAELVPQGKRSEGLTPAALAFAAAATVEQMPRMSRRGFLAGALAATLGFAASPSRPWEVKPDRMTRAPSPQELYALLWESINGPGSWDANPWVWVVEFRRVSCP